MFDILEKVNEWLAASTPLAIATVVETWGSAPRQAGAKMVVTADTTMIGSVSGGCVETAVIGEMIDSLADQQPRLLAFGVSDDEAWSVGLACGGSIAVFVEPLNLAWWRLLEQYADQRFATATVLSGDLAGAKILFPPSGKPFMMTMVSQSMLVPLMRFAETATSTTRILVGDRDILFEVYRPRPRLVIVGGAHVAMALQQYAAILGFRVLLIDPRRAFATPERFPHVESISHEYPHIALQSIPLDGDTYLALLTHDPKIDDPALQTALPSDVAYIGVLSSRRTHEKRLERLTAAGVDPALFGRIRTPIGLNIGARTPEEIALAIVSEIIAVRNA